MRWPWQKRAEFIIAPWGPSTDQPITFDPRYIDQVAVAVSKRLEERAVEKAKLRRPTQRDLDRGRELADEHGWD